MATTTAPLICPQGHGPGLPGAGFCISCGAQLVGAVAPGPATPPMAASAAPMAAAASPTYVQPAGPGIQMWTPSTPAVPPQGTTPYAGPPTGAPGGAASGWTPVAQAMPPQGTAPFAGPPAGAPGGWTPTPQFPTPPVGPPAGWTPPKAKGTGKPAAAPPPPCSACGDGVLLSPTEDICTQCGWLRPLFPGYQLDPSVFLWAQDGQAMSKLQSISALRTVVKTVSDKVGRPWIESTFNAIRLGPRQLPDVWKQAILAARIMGLPKMPDVYISGDQMWNTYTYGTESSSFIVLGTSHLINFANDEMLFVLAREMGHCRAGHALWKTVIRFLAGDTAVHSGVLSNGILNAISPSKLIEGALDMPLMAWSRQSDITADRAGLLAVGDESLARRVLLAWSIRSARLLQQVNIDEWMKQEDASDDSMTKFTEMTTSATMYTTRRLRLLGQAAREPGLMQWSQSIQPVRKQLAPPPSQIPGLGVGTVKVVKTTTTQSKVVSASAGAATRTAPGQVPVRAVGPTAPGSGAPAGPMMPASGSAPAAAPADSVRVVCNKCQAPMRIPLAILRGKAFLNVRCPQCHNVLTLRPKAPAAVPAQAQAGTQAAGGAGTKPAAPVSAAAPGAAAKNANTANSPAPTAAGPQKTKSPAPTHAPASAGAKPTSGSRPPAAAGRKK